MANVVVLLAVALLAVLAISFVQRRRHSFVPRRGISIGADLGAMSDQPRVRVQEVALIGPDRIRLLLTPDRDDETDPTTRSDLEAIVSVGDDQLELLRHWQQSASPLAIVIPPESRLIRLRSIEDLQPLTLRRVD
jgi:hypothetical protein